MNIRSRIDPQPLCLVYERSDALFSLSFESSKIQYCIYSVNHPGREGGCMLVQGGCSFEAVGV